MNLPTGPYRVLRPSTREAEPYLPWLIDKAVRVGRDNGYGNLVDQGLTLILADLGVRTPAGGFVDSDGRNANGVRNGGYDANGFGADGFNRQGFDKDGFNRDGVNANGEDRDDVIAAMVDSWDSDTAAAYAAALANRVS
jgi:hypothetical protein